MTKYVCIKGFCLDAIDECGSVEEDGASIVAGSVWVDRGQDYRMIGGEARLETDDESKWIEIPRDMIPAFFKELQPKGRKAMADNKRWWVYLGALVVIGALTVIGGIVAAIIRLVRWLT